MPTPPGRLGRLVRRALVVVLVLVVAAGLVGWRYGYLDDVYDHFRSSSGPADDAGPAAVAPPAGLDLPAVAAPAAVASAASGSTLSTAAIRQAVARSLHDKHLGKHVRALVAPLAGGAPAYSLGHGTATPASTTKLLTTTAALLALGPSHRFTTSVVETRGAGGPPRVVLVGGGDPYLARTPDDAQVRLGAPRGTDVATLAAQAAAALKRHGVHRVRVGYDASLFTGPAVNPHWEPDYITTAVVAPISALWVDEGRPASDYGRVADPASDAGAAFAAALAKDGVTVVGGPTSTPHARGTTLASGQSAPLSQIVERILMVSDNEGAEVLLRQTALAAGRSGSFVDGVTARAAQLSRAGVTVHGVLYDGSGLSRSDRLDPATLLAVLRLDASASHPELRSVVSGLPVAGFDGSLADRMDKGPHAGLGRVRAKTGTLTGVSSLAGIAVDLDGTPMAFVLMADKIPAPDELTARVAEDDAAAALGACHCS